jgi:hypothetical protein
MAAAVVTDAGECNPIRHNAEMQSAIVEGVIQSVLRLEDSPVSWDATLSDGNAHTVTFPKKLPPTEYTVGRPSLIA